MESKDSARFGGAAAPTFGGPGAALVTGAGAGLGRAIAVALARCGDAVMVCDIDPDGGRETVAVIEAAGGTARFEPCNVAVPADAERAVAALFAQEVMTVEEAARRLVKQPKTVTNQLTTIYAKLESYFGLTPDVGTKREFLRRELGIWFGEDGS